MHESQKFFCYNGREINKYIITNIFEADKSFSLELTFSQNK